MVWFYLSATVRAVARGMSAFNPTMVWFYQRISDIVIVVTETAFNPTMVWFYPARPARPAQAGSTFNPTMVWFYHNGLYLFIVRCEAFQSHYGLILSQRTLSVYSKVWSLSIPLWSDFILLQRSQTETWNFQSHYGLILSWRFFNRSFERSLLSIPLWSDFIARPVRAGRPAGSHFQSHYGLILSKFLEHLASVSPELAFNPTMVWFYHR